MSDDKIYYVEEQPSAEAILNFESLVKVPTKPLRKLLSSSSKDLYLVPSPYSGSVEIEIPVDKEAVAPCYIYRYDETANPSGLRNSISLIGKVDRRHLKILLGVERSYASDDGDVSDAEGGDYRLLDREGIQNSAIDLAGAEVNVNIEPIDDRPPHFVMNVTHQVFNDEAERDREYVRADVTIRIPNSDIEKLIGQIESGGFSALSIMLALPVWSLASAPIRCCFDDYEDPIGEPLFLLEGSLSGGVLPGLDGFAIRPQRSWTSSEQSVKEEPYEGHNNNDLREILGALKVLTYVIVALLAFVFVKFV